jgi:hypothetical protein
MPLTPNGKRKSGRLAHNNDTERLASPLEGQVIPYALSLALCHVSLHVTTLCMIRLDVCSTVPLSTNRHRHTIVIASRVRHHSDYSQTCSATSRHEWMACIVSEDRHRQEVAVGACVALWRPVYAPIRVHSTPVACLRTHCRDYKINPEELEKRVLFVLV